MNLGVYVNSFILVWRFNKDKCKSNFMIAPRAVNEITSALRRGDKGDVDAEVTD